MSESNVISNLINYITSGKNSSNQRILPNIILCQAALASSDFEKVISAIEKIRAAGESDEENTRLINEIDTITSDREWTFSEYKQKAFLAKFNRYFEYCYENVAFVTDDRELAKLYLEFIKTRLDMEYGFCYLALARYYMTLANYETVFNIMETVINKFPDSKYEYFALCDLLEIYKMEYQSLERSGENFMPVIEKIVQILLYVLKSYSYQPRSFYTIIKFAHVVFKYEHDITARSFYEKLSETYAEAIYEEEIKLEFVNYYIGHNKLKEATVYLNEFEKVFNKTTKKNVINLYRFECYISLNDTVAAYNVYKSLDEKQFSDNADAILKYYHLTCRFAGVLENAKSLKDSLSIYEKIYKASPVKKLKEDALYKLITLNINIYFNNKESMPGELKNIVRGYCVSFISKFSKSQFIDEIKLVYESINNAAPATPLREKTVIAPSDKPANGSNEIKQSFAEIKTNETIRHKKDTDVKTVEKKELLTAASRIDEKKKEKTAPDENKSKDIARDLAADEKKSPEELKKVTAADVVKTASSSSNAAGAVSRAATNIKKYDEAAGNEPKNGGVDFLKLSLYFLLAIFYAYAFILLPTSSLSIFYSKILMSYFPFLCLTAMLLYALFKKLNVFE